MNNEKNSWEGRGLDEVGKEKGTGIIRVKVNPKYFRPSEVVISRINLIF